MKQNLQRLRQSQLSGYVRSRAYRRFGVAVAVISFCVFADSLASAQTNSLPREKAPALTQLSSAKDELGRLTAEYQESLRRLAQVYRDDLNRAQDQLVRVQGLLGRGLMTQREVAGKTAEVAALQVKLDELERETAAADEQMADMLAEADAIEQLALRPVPAMTVPGRTIVGASFVRFTGLGSWSLAGAPAIKNFFQQRFGRPLPIGAFGQSRLHDLWHWDHRNAMDVGLNPGSVEGQALIAYLRANGIPFGAFRQAIPGVATGPHIHVGMPSHRLPN